MTGRAKRRDERAVSETSGIAILVGFTVLVTASVGISVLFVDVGDDEGISANFSFDYQSDQSSLLVTHQRGDALPAGELVFEGRPGSVTWAELAGQPANTSVGPDSLVQLSAGNAWGSRVRTGDSVEIYYVPSAGNRTLLDSYEVSP